MEELSLYRHRIGLFANVAYHCSCVRKTKKRLRIPPKKNKKVKNKERNLTANCSLKKETNRHPSRLGPLVLMLLISVRCLNERSNSVTSLPKVGILKPSFHFIGFNLTNEYNFRITSGLQISQVGWQNSDINEETIRLKPYLRRRNKITNRCLQSQICESKYFLGNVTVNKTFDRYFPWWPSLKVFIRYFLIIVKDFSSDIGTIEVLHYGKLNNTNNGSVYSSFCLISMMGADVIFITIFFGLGTCCYLLGNKGMHILNGNPKQKSGDAQLTKTTLTLVKQRVDESVGYISTKNTLPYDGDWDITYTNAGTGFRAGDKYFITAYHVLKEKIDQLLDEICLEMPDSKLASILKVLNQRTETVVDENMQRVSKKDVNKAVTKYAKQTATNIPMLLNVLGEIIDTEDMENVLTKSWKEKCMVDFIEHGRFYMDWKIAFGDKEIDIAVIKLTQTKPGQMYPRPLLLDDDYRADRNYCVVRYITGTTPHVVVDQDSRTFKDDGELDGHVQAALNWWANKTSLGNEFNNKYASCMCSYNEDTGRVVLKASKSFQHGASGSPIVYLFNNDGQPVVAMVYQRGLPEHFYYALRSNNKTGRLLKHLEIDGEVCLFESGTTMKRLYHRIIEAGNVDLRKNIFSQPGQPKGLYFREGQHKRVMNPNINRLNTMICQSRSMLEFQTCEASSFPYVKTTAFERAIEIFEKNNIIVIVGNPGDGKTALAYQLMKLLTEEVISRQYLLITGRTKPIFTEHTIPAPALYYPTADKRREVLPFFVFSLRYDLYDLSGNRNPWPRL